LRHNHKTRDLGWGQLPSFLPSLVRNQKLA
jgi:hypothetical protein